MLTSFVLYFQSAPDLLDLSVGRLVQDRNSRLGSDLRTHVDVFSQGNIVSGYDSNDKGVEGR